MELASRTRSGSSEQEGRRYLKPVSSVSITYVAGAPLETQLNVSSD